MNLLQVMRVCAASAIGGFAARASAEALYYREDNHAVIAGAGVSMYACNHVGSIAVSETLVFVLTDVVKCGEEFSERGPLDMKAKNGAGRKRKAQSTAAVCATISFPSELYETLGMIAKGKKVSLAWVVRAAAEQYIGEKWPLFKGRE